MTPEGLRIQILDEDAQLDVRPGSAVPNERARLLLQKVAPVLAQAAAGHLDRRAYRRGAVRGP